MKPRLVILGKRIGQGFFHLTAAVIVILLRGDIIMAAFEEKCALHKDLAIKTHCWCVKCTLPSVSSCILHRLFFLQYEDPRNHKEGKWSDCVSLGRPSASPCMHSEGPAAQEHRLLLPLARPPGAPCPAEQQVVPSDTSPIPTEPRTPSSLPPTCSFPPDSTAVKGPEVQEQDPAGFTQMTGHWWGSFY